MGSDQNSNSSKLLLMAWLPARIRRAVHNEDATVDLTFLPLKVYGDFSRCSRAANSTVPSLILPNFKPIQDIMAVLVSCKNKGDPIKNKCPRVVTTSYMDFSDAQGQLTP